MSYEGVSDRDYTGVPTAELAAVYTRSADCDLRTFASRIDMDERDLKKIVVSQNYPFTGLGVADKILLGLGIRINDLVDSGDIHIVPARGSRNAALKMVEDSILVANEQICHEHGINSVSELRAMGVDVPTDEEIHEHIIDILRLRGEVVMKTPEQEERLRKDSERSSVRLAEKKRREREDRAA